MADSIANKIFGEPATFGGVGGYYYALGFLSIGFLALTYNSTLAIIYTAFLLADLAIFMAKKPSLNFNSVSGNTLNSFIIAGVVMALFVVATIAIMALFQGLLQIKGDFFALFSQYAFTSLGMASQNPIFQNNVFITFITYVLVIGTIETRMLGRFLDVLRDMFRLDYNLKSISTWVAFVVMAIGFVFLHIQAKGVTGIPLLLVGLFALISCVMIVKFREFESATYFHWFNNAFAIMGVR